MYIYENPYGGLFVSNVPLNIENSKYVGYAHSKEDAYVILRNYPDANEFIHNYFNE